MGRCGASKLWFGSLAEVASADVRGRIYKAAEKSRKSFLQGLKLVASTQFASALKHRPPKEKTFFRRLLHRAEPFETQREQAPTDSGGLLRYAGSFLPHWDSLSQRR